MNKLLSMVAVLFIAFHFTSFIEKNAIPGEGLIEGYKAPSFVMNDLSSDSFKGKKVLISFWAAYDAASRASNALLAAQIQKQSADIRLVSIGFDPSAVIFEETVRLEKLDKSTQYHDRNGSSSEIFQAFCLKEGFGNYLLNEEGVIIAKNLDPKRLNELLNNEK
ncbi:MAG: TlpA family protein disulfide reductase [Bacteroidales bacterium]